MSFLGPARSQLPPALHHRDFRRLFSGFLTSGFATQMVAVAVGWQVYAIHQSAFDLGLIGLAEFVPLPLLALPAGQVADRLPRVRLFTASILAEAVIAALLLLVTIQGAHELWPFITLAILTGVTQAFGAPAGRSLTPEIVPTDLLASALALRSVAGQLATVAGPAAGGLLFAIDPEALYVIAVTMLVVSAGWVLIVPGPDIRPQATSRRHGSRACSEASG